MVVSGDEGLDELSLAGGNSVAAVHGRAITRHRVHAADVDLPAAPIAALRGGDARENAAALRRLLHGEPGAYRDAVVLNAAAALIVAGAEHDWRTAAQEAAETIDKGLASALLDCWIATLR